MIKISDEKIKDIILRCEILEQIEKREIERQWEIGYKIGKAVAQEGEQEDIDAKTDLAYKMLAQGVDIDFIIEKITENNNNINKTKE